MANEIRVTLSGHVRNGYYRDDFSFGQISINQANPGRGGHVQIIGTSEETIDFGNVSTEGILVMRNLDATNFITWGPDTDPAGTPTMELLGKMKPGELAFLRVAPGVVIRAKADTASCKLDVRLYED